jgi:hypothetical protein
MFYIRFAFASVLFQIVAPSMDLIPRGEILGGDRSGGGRLVGLSGDRLLVTESYQQHQDDEEYGSKMYEIMKATHGCASFPTTECIAETRYWEELRQSNPIDPNDFLECALINRLLQCVIGDYSWDKFLCTLGLWKSTLELRRCCIPSAVDSK